MNQILHIFRKDTRRFWLEILISLAILIGFVLYAPLTWRPFDDFNRGNSLRQWIVVMTALVPLGWWLLIARVIHAETLVGENQFWITRPYDRRKLLTAKLLFIACWVCVPFFLAQLLLLWEAGFRPLHYALALLPCLEFIGALFLLPLLALAAVTANFARMTLSLLAGLACITAFGFSGNFSHHGYYSINPYHQTFFLYPLLLLSCAAAIVLQYIARRVWFARAILVILPFLAVAIVFSYKRSSLVDRAYPRHAGSAAASGSTPPIQVLLEPDNRSPVESRGWDGDDFIDITIRYAGVSQSQAVAVDNFKFTLTSASGDSWTSPWESTYVRVFPGEGHPSGIALKLTPALFGRFQSGPVTLYLTFAITRLQAGATTETTYPSDDAAIPGVGFCSREGTRGGWSTVLGCRYALRQPQLTYAAATWWDTPCSGPAPASNAATIQSGAWIGDPDPPTTTSVSTPSRPTSYSSIQESTRMPDVGTSAPALPSPSPSTTS